jgi:precorrin-6x reductase
MILLFGGTSEGKQLAALLASQGLAFVYSTKEKTDFAVPPSCRYRHGSFTAESLAGFCAHLNVRLLLDGSHPFAAGLHRTISEAARSLGIPVLRFERNCQSPLLHELAVYLDGFSEALEYLRLKGIGKLLALTGIQSIGKLKAHWTDHDTWFRILPRPESLEMARLQGLAERFILPGLPSSDVDEEIGLIRRYGVEAALTKESGEAGGLSAKIAAAISCHIPILILRKPPIPEAFAVVRSEAEFLQWITPVSTWT